MATIYSNRNDNASNHVTISALNSSAWSGGTVPTSVDQVYIVGRRTTINQSSISKWSGTINITVSSTANFPSTGGFFYTYTDRGEFLKINYTGISGNTFTGCSLDFTDSFYSWNDDGVIPNGAYVHNPALIITINQGETFECDELIIQEGGYLFVNGGTLRINKGIIVRDGRFIARNSSQIIIARNSANLANVGYLISENYPLQIIDFDGGENRTYASLANNVNIGDAAININNISNGSFAPGDEISIYKPTTYRLRNRGYSGFRDATANFKDLNEVFTIAYIDGNTIYIALKNGSQGIIKDIKYENNYDILYVQPKDSYFKAGDKIVTSSGQVAVIDKVEDGEYELYSYDFTNPNTSLNDFIVNDPIAPYSSGWEIESGVGLRNTNSAYRELVHKYFWGREVIIEAELSPLSGFYTGTRGSNGFGLMTAYDPTFLWGHRGYDSFKTNYLRIDDANDIVHFYIRSMGNYIANRRSRNTWLQNTIRSYALYRIETRRFETKVFINGREFTTEFHRDGNFAGLVGIYVDSNTNFRCKSLKIKIPVQKLYIDAQSYNFSASIGETVYLTGCEQNHQAGEKVVKLSSYVTNLNGHDNLAFGYRGAIEQDSIYPQVIQINGSNSTNSSLPYLINNDFNYDYYYDLGNTTSPRSITIDLGTQRTFTHVSFLPRVIDYGSFYGYRQVRIYGSNDLSNWTTLYGPADDTKVWYRYQPNRLAFYPTGTVSYRYIKFETQGSIDTNYNNRYVKIGVHNFSDGYKITVNNASDINVGDKITVTSTGGFYYANYADYVGYYSWVTAQKHPDEYLQGGWLLECTVVNKSGNTLTLDRPIFWTYLDPFHKELIRVLKVNKNLKVTGEIGPTKTANDWKWPYIYLGQGTAIKRILFRNVEFRYIGSYRYSGSSSHNRCITVAYTDYWNAALFDGVSYIAGNDGTTWSGIASYYSKMLIHNSLIIQSYSGISNYYRYSYTGIGIFGTYNLGGYYSAYLTWPGICNISYNTFCSMRPFSIEIPAADAGVLVHPFIVNRNIFIPGDYTGAYIYATYNISANRILLFENNKILSTDDYILAGRNFGMDSFCNGLITYSLHTGLRVSRYRNEGFFTEWEGADILTTHHVNYDFMRFGYHLGKNVYHFIKFDPQNPSILRIYHQNGDAYLPYIGLSLEALQDTNIKIDIAFNYKIPLINQVQDDGTDDGRIRVLLIKNGEIVTTKYGVLPQNAGDGWNLFNESFEITLNKWDQVHVFVNQSAQNGYIDLTNIRASIFTNEPDKIIVKSNTFNTRYIFRQLEAPSAILNLNYSGQQNIIKFGL